VLSFSGNTGAGPRSAETGQSGSEAEMTNESAQLNILADSLGVRTAVAGIQANERHVKRN